MKKILLILLLFCTTKLPAQTESEYITFSDVVDNPAFEEELFSHLDMKILHDKQIMQEIIPYFYQQQDPEAIEEDIKITRGILKEKDSDILEASMRKRKIQYSLPRDLLKKASERPFDAFKDAIKGTRISKMPKEEMDTLNQVDKKAIPKMMQMITESGPDVGAGMVGINYVR